MKLKNKNKFKEKLTNKRQRINNLEFNLTISKN